MQEIEVRGSVKEERNNFGYPKQMNLRAIIKDAQRFEEVVKGQVDDLRRSR